MKKIKEFELLKIIKTFNNKKILLEFTDILKATIKIENSIIKYSRSNGIIIIKDTKTKNVFEIDTSPVYEILVSENMNILQISLDNDLTICLEKE